MKKMKKMGSLSLKVEKDWLDLEVPTNRGCAINPLESHIKISTMLWPTHTLRVLRLLQTTFSTFFCNTPFLTSFIYYFFLKKKYYCYNKFTIIGPHITNKITLHFFCTDIYYIKFTSCSYYCMCTYKKYKSSLKLWC